MAMAFSIVMCLHVCALASEIETDSFQNAMVSYDVPGSYMIYIPMDIAVGDRVSIHASELNIPDNKAVQVKFNGLSNDGSTASFDVVVDQAREQAIADIEAKKNAVLAEIVAFVNELKETI